MLVEIDLVAIAQFGGSSEMLLDLCFFLVALLSKRFRNNRYGKINFVGAHSLSVATNFGFVDSNLLAMAGSLQQATTQHQ